MNFLNTINAPIIILVFLIITYGFSAYEKITDWKGTITYIKNHFENSLLKNYTHFLVFILLLIEITSVLFMFVGLKEMLFNNTLTNAIIGIKITCLSVILMLIGQRFAKDYVGATSLTVYFILSVFGLYILQ